MTLFNSSYRCAACRDFGVIAVDADNVIACRNCNPTPWVHSHDNTRRHPERTGDRYYLTRDSDVDGTLDAEVDVWLTRPIRHRCDVAGGYVWVSSDVRTYRRVNHGRDRWRRISVDECMKRFGTVPLGDGVCLLLAEVE